MNDYHTYGGSVLEVLSYIKTDHELIHDLAHASDVLKFWENPDTWDYPVTFKGDFPATASFQEIKSRQTLTDLAGMYKRLKAGTKIPSVMFKTILLKMLWISSSRGVSKAA